MRGKYPSLTPLAARKQLLLAESEINRAEFGREWNCLGEEAAGLAHQARSLAMLATTGAALFASGSVLRRWLFKRSDHKPSWVGNLINGVRNGISIGLALRSRVR